MKLKQRYPYAGIAMSLAFAAAPMANASIILAGWHAFTKNDSDREVVTSNANEGVVGVYDAPLTYVAHGNTGTGGSTDNWYGPDSLENGGMKTQQTAFDTFGEYIFETSDPSGPRMSPGFVDPFGGANEARGIQPGTTMDGRITQSNGTLAYFQNNTQQTFSLESFVFDAHLSRASEAGSFGRFENFALTYTAAGQSPISYTVNAVSGRTGYNTQGGGVPLDTLISPNPGGQSIDVRNQIDYGTGGNYLDFVIDLAGFEFKPGDQISILFRQVESGSVRIDNLALFAVPEPSSMATLAALVSSGMFFRRRKM